MLMSLTMENAELVGLAMSSPGFQPELAPKVPPLGGASYANNQQHAEALAKVMKRSLD
jgi:hypothetical protein